MLEKLDGIVKAEKWISFLDDDEFMRQPKSVLDLFQKTLFDKSIPEDILIYCCIITACKLDAVHGELCLRNFYQKYQMTARNVFARTPHFWLWWAKRSAEATKTANASSICSKGIHYTFLVFQKVNSLVDVFTAIKIGFAAFEDLFKELDAAVKSGNNFPTIPLPPSVFENETTNAVLTDNSAVREKLTKLSLSDVNV